MSINNPRVVRFDWVAYQSLETSFCAIEERESANVDVWQIQWWEAISDR
jgi:hypothetical protein